MQTSIQTSALYSDLLGDEELAGILASSTEIRAMIRVELALAQAQSDIGMIPDTAGAAMATALADVPLDMEVLAQGISGSGVPVPAMLAQLRKALPAELSQWLHWGATSQDIVDTASMLQMADCLNLFGTRLSQLLDTLHAQSKAHATTVMAARTRTQFATPITLGLRLAQWAQPLIRMETQLATLKADVLRVQFGGAAGANTAVAPHGPAIAAAMAGRLNLSNSPPWHTDRSGIIAVSGWLLQVCLSLSKMAKDLMIMSRSEVAELTAGHAGGSSTMPQKANPIQSEMVVALGTIAQALHGGLCAAASPVEERDGASWTVEWVLLPQLLVTTGCALRHALVLADTLSVDAVRMQSTVHDNSQLMAEAASFALAEHLPRAEAQALVKRAATRGVPLPQALTLELAERADIDLDWDKVLDPNLACDPGMQISEAIFSSRSG